MMSEEKKSVVRGMNRRAGNIEPVKSNIKYATKEVNVVEKIDNKVITQERSQKKEFKNQQQQIKVSASIKEELNALKSITKTKFDYEIIELLIDSYTQHLTPMQRRKFKTMTMSDDEE